MQASAVAKAVADGQPAGTGQADRSDPADSIPACPACGKPMVLRTAKSGKNEGQQFWGCSAYPECRGTAKI